MHKFIKSYPSGEVDTEEGHKKQDIIRYINLKLAAIGQPIFDDRHLVAEDETLTDARFMDLTRSLISDYRNKTRMVSQIYSPADQRIQNFLQDYLRNTGEPIPQLPHNTFIVDKQGLARELSLPPHGNEFKNSEISSYRIQQGILHNPKNDRRTTKGTFHIVAGGLPVPADKIEVPEITFARMLQAAFQPPEDLNLLPFTSQQDKKAHTFISLLTRPVVSPEVKNISPRRSMEVRFFAPGSLVSNIDFVESIFGNAGNPFDPANDAGLDAENWSGHTGCIVLAPQLTHLTKKQTGLPHYDEATERQRQDGMCWKRDDEIYNNGKPFKLTCRDDRGIAVTLVADNYFGYSKKEIKTHISYSANLLGLAEEEHSGGAIAFSRKNIGTSFKGKLFMEHRLKKTLSFSKTVAQFGGLMKLQPEGFGIDKKFPNIIYIPENTEIDLDKGIVQWEKDGRNQQLNIQPNHYYIYPSGHKLHMEKHPSAPSWRLVSTNPTGTFCHKPSTVSGGGKSEISKSLLNAIIYGSFYVQDFDKDFKAADDIIKHNFTDRWKDPGKRKKDARRLLSSDRTLGSVIKLLTPSSQYTSEFNAFVESIPAHVKALVFYIKRFYRPDRIDSDWKDFFTTDVINGRKGNELLFINRKIMASYLRIGFETNNSWRLHKLRADFVAAAKIQMEDDITASITLPAKYLDYVGKSYKNQSVKLVENCESRFFQRPDEAINRGYDKEAEADLSLRNNFTSNYEPLSTENGKAIVNDAINFDRYTKPIQKLIREGARDQKGRYFITPSHPRIVGGKPSKNPRYLQTRPDLVNPVDDYLAEIGMRFHYQIDLSKPVYFLIDAVLPGRRNNPPEKETGIRGLSVYNPIHYQELPELFMDFICSLTGKSPSTTGAGTEGALTKGPFNMLCAVSDLNNALLSFILTGYQGFSSAAGHVGTRFRFDHDISLLIPELWSRMSVEDREPAKLIKEGSLEKLNDFTHKGQKVRASRLGYRITETFTFNYLNTIFDEPQAVFNEEMLRPEKQDMEAFVDGINNIVEAQQRVALHYFEDGSVETAIPPLKALLHIMAFGHFEGKEASDAAVRKLFERNYVINSDWYKERLLRKQQIDIQFLQERITYINKFTDRPENLEYVHQLELDNNLRKIKKQLEYIRSAEYLRFLEGTIGADPIYRK